MLNNNNNKKKRKHVSNIQLSKALLCARIGDGVMDDLQYNAANAPPYVEMRIDVQNCTEKW